MSTDLHGLSDGALASRALAGTLAAFDELVRRHERRVFGLMLRRAGNRQTAEDLTQETFVAAYRKLERYDPTRPFFNWLCAIGVRLAADLYRRESRRSERLTMLLPPDADRVPSPEESFMRDQDTRSLWQLARDSLPGRQFDALSLHYGEDKPVAEVAVILGTSRGNAKVLLHRARRCLTAQLERASLHVPTSAPVENEGARS